MKFICSHNAYTVCSKHPYKSTSNRLTRKKRTQHAIAGGKKGENPTERTKGRKEKRRKRCGVRTETLGTERRELSAGRTPIAATTVGKVEAKVEANASPPPLCQQISVQNVDVVTWKGQKKPREGVQFCRVLGRASLPAQWGCNGGTFGVGGGHCQSCMEGGRKGKRGGPTSKQECEQTAELGAAESRGRWAAVDLLL